VATVLLYAARKNADRDDKLPSPFIQQADRVAVRETARENPPTMAQPGNNAVIAAPNSERASELSASAPGSASAASAQNGASDAIRPLKQNKPRDVSDDGGIPLPPGGIHVVGPVSTPAELGYSPQAQYDAQHYDNEMRFAPRYDHYGQQVVEAQGAAAGVIYDPYYGYGYGFGYGPVTNYGEAAINGQVYTPDNSSGER